MEARARARHHHAQFPIGRGGQCEPNRWIVAGVVALAAPLVEAAVTELVALPPLEQHASIATNAGAASTSTTLTITSSMA